MLEILTTYMETWLSYVLCLQLVLHHRKRKSIASCRRHVTRCNLDLQLAMVSKQSMQSLQEVELRSTLCSRCKLIKVATQVAKRVFYTLQLAPNTSYRAPFHFLQRLQRYFKNIASCNSSLHFYFENIASCRTRLQRVTCFFQLAMDFFFQHCKTSCKKSFTV